MANFTPEKELEVSEFITLALAKLGARYAFGVSGGAQAKIWAALSTNPDIQVCHCRHESGAAFSAAETYFASGRPAIVFTTAGPGFTNAITGLFAARDEGAKVVALSAFTSEGQRGRWAIQETSDLNMPIAGLYSSAGSFDYANILENPDQLPHILRDIAEGLSRPGGFVAHLSIPTKIQSENLTVEPDFFQDILPSKAVSSQARLSEELMTTVVNALENSTFVIWVGFGARFAHEELLELAERLSAPVICSPRAKGIFPEDHDLYCGITGIGGTPSSRELMEEFNPDYVLVLGSRLGEGTSLWQPEMAPRKAFIHVDIDPRVCGLAYPKTQTIFVRSDIRHFLTDLLKQIKRPANPVFISNNFRPQYSLNLAYESGGLIRPQALMQAIQRAVVEKTRAIVLADAGNSFVWASNLLRFRHGGRYRVSTCWGSMGHAAAGVFGAALAGNGKGAVAITGDGSMLMSSGEINTAAKFNARCIWIVLNDSRYNMCHQGMNMLGMENIADASFPQVNFALLAEAMGVTSIVVERETQLEDALEHAWAVNGPVVVDVRIDPDCVPPVKGRNQGLAMQGLTANGNKTGGGPSFPAMD